MTLVAFAGKVTPGAAVATPGFVELRTTVNPAAGAGVDRVSVRFCVDGAVIAKLAGEKPMVGPEPTCTDWLAGAKPVAEAVIAAVPALTPVTVGARLAVVAFWGTKILSGATVTLEVSPLTSEIKTPPEGAGAARVTWNDAD